MNRYPHGQHSYQKASAKYGHGLKAFTTAKKPGNGEDDGPNENYGNDVSIEHGDVGFVM